MHRPALVSLMAAAAFAHALLAQAGRPAASDAPLAASERTERPAPAAEWKEGANLVRAFVSSEHAAPGPSFGEWFGVESAPPPDGWVLGSATFHLVGDRACAGTDASPKGAGVSSECRQDLRTDRVVRWAFRVEARDAAEEAGAWKVALAAGSGRVVASGAARTSRGIVICTYVPAAAAGSGSK